MNLYGDMLQTYIIFSFSIIKMILSFLLIYFKNSLENELKSKCCPGIQVGKESEI